MAEWTYALASVAEFKLANMIASTGQDPLLEEILKRASETIEAHLGREIVTRSATADITEYHSTGGCASELLLLEWPLISITSVKEGGWSGGSWVATQTLTSSDYLARRSDVGVRLVRMSGGVPWLWPSGYESVQVVYKAGYADTASVPGPIKDVCLSLASRKYAQAKRGSDGSVQSVSDGLGTVSRFLPAELLRIEADQLFPWRNLAQSTTGRKA